MVPRSQVLQMHALYNQAESHGCHTRTLPDSMLAGSLLHNHRGSVSFSSLGYNKGRTGFSGLGPGATFHSIPFLWNPMLLARALLEAPQSMIATAESFLPRAAGLCSRLLREYLGFRLRRVSKWPNPATGWAAWPAPGSSCRGQVQGDGAPALGREAA